MDGRRTVCSRVGSDLEWVGLGQGMLGIEVRLPVLISGKPRELGEPGGLADGLARTTDDGRLVGTPSARGEGLRGA